MSQMLSRRMRRYNQVESVNQVITSITTVVEEQDFEKQIQEFDS